MSANTADFTHYRPSSPERTIDDYADIIHRSRPHAPHPMSPAARAAQFAPYAALTGHQDLIDADEQTAKTRVNLTDDVTIEYDEYDEPADYSAS